MFLGQAIYVLGPLQIVSRDRKFCDVSRAFRIDVRFFCN